ncbi:hypothetical protein MKZ87_07315 [Pseudomonas sp. MCal1]|uniref:hypothetical protein n=1 Tax=Pseudomonas sp. MCal1 TaxID=2919887 RepID=UPI0022544FC4|nr:hypothetical protein [Pseudomonas sp. MCal1]MCX4217446.1 hypothetical protein [Pseudomonas sp. MCal1]
MGNVFGERWLIFFYCLLLFFSGCVFGFIFTKDTQLGFIAFLSAISSIATVGAAITAVFALRSWKAQFQLQKKYDAVIAVRGFLHGATHPRIYLASLSNHLAEYLRSRNDRALADDFPEEDQRNWFNHVSEFGKAWDVMMVLLSKSELEQFDCSPTILGDMVRVAKDAMIEITFGEKDINNLDREDKKLIGLQNINRVHSIKIESAYSDMEKQSRTLLGKLAS